MSNKKIKILDQSSLIGLRAELTRKLEDALSSKKIETKPKTLKLKREDSFVNKKVVKEKKLKSKSGEEHDLTCEESEVIDFSKNILEAKSKLYDKLCNKEDVCEDKANFLVNFDQKEEIKKVEKSDDVENDDQYSDNEDDWVEYTDSFGRTRRCLRTDLDYFKEKDVVASQQEKPAEKKEPTAELLSWDMKREELRQKWEQEQILLSQKKDIHYQDILFDEARVHGTGYYEFSKDEEERKQQQESLLKMRQETLEKQRIVQEIKQRREMMMKSRLEAATRRKRLRLGLPPEEEGNREETKVVEEPENKETEEQQRKMEEFAEKVKENLEKIRRAAHIRPWDIGKDGIHAPVLTQEEWVEKKRSERIEEFAPPPSYLAEQESTTLYFTTKKAKLNTRPKAADNLFGTKAENCPPQSDPGCSLSSESYLSPNKTDEACRYTAKNVKVCGSPIISDHSDDEDEKRTTQRRMRGVQVPPPSIYHESSVRTKSATSVNLKQSVEAGFEYLKNVVEENEKKREKGFLG